MLRSWNAGKRSVLLESLTPSRFHTSGLQAVKVAQRQQEYAAIRLSNVELMTNYGVNAWRAYNSALEDSNALLKAEIEKVDAEVGPANPRPALPPNIRLSMPTSYFPFPVQCRLLFFRPLIFHSPFARHAHACTASQPRPAERGDARPARPGRSSASTASGSWSRRRPAPRCAGPAPRSPPPPPLPPSTAHTCVCAVLRTAAVRSSAEGPGRPPRPPPTA